MTTFNSSKILDRTSLSLCCSSSLAFTPLGGESSFLLATSPNHKEKCNKFDIYENGAEWRNLRIQCSLVNFCFSCPLQLEWQGEIEKFERSGTQFFFQLGLFQEQGHHAYLWSSYPRALNHKILQPWALPNKIFQFLPLVLPLSRIH